MGKDKKKKKKNIIENNQKKLNKEINETKKEETKEKINEEIDDEIDNNTDDDIDDKINKNIYIKKNIIDSFKTLDIASNPIHGKDGIENQAREVIRNNDIINEYIQDTINYFFNFFKN